jgi:flavin reductase (DIM6/NTAB) family NADH-FMN oxidoreductase RutF
MASFATGVTVVSYKVDGEHRGLTANAFMSVSLEPMLVLVSIRKVSRFCSAVHLGQRYGVSLLSAHQQNVCSKYAGMSADAEFPLVEMSGVQVIADSMVQLVAQVTAIHEAGDHRLYIGRIEDVSISSVRSPLVYFGGDFGDFRLRQTEISNGPRMTWPDMAIN